MQLSIASGLATGNTAGDLATFLSDTIIVQPPYYSYVCLHQMENIGQFLNSCYDYGLEKNDVFQTVDLYDNTNIPQVSHYTQHWKHHYY